MLPGQTDLVSAQTAFLLLKAPWPPQLPGSLTSNGALLVLVELSLDKAEDEAGFAHCRLPQEDQLKLTDFVASSWSIGACCTSPTRHGPMLGSSTSERGGGAGARQRGT